MATFNVSVNVTVSLEAEDEETAEARAVFALSRAGEKGLAALFDSWRVLIDSEIMDVQRS